MICRCSGESLRRRSGGSDQGWHLKLPLDGAGTSLAEVATDDVSARTMGESTTLTHWHEVEVELTGGGPRLLKAAAKRLRHSGLRPAGHSAKLARALAPAGRPREIALHETSACGRTWPARTRSASVSCTRAVSAMPSSSRSRRQRDGGGSSRPGDGNWPSSNSRWHDSRCTEAVVSLGQTGRAGWSAPRPATRRRVPWHTAAACGGSQRSCRTCPLRCAWFSWSIAGSGSRRSR